MPGVTPYEYNGDVRNLPYRAPLGPKRRSLRYSRGGERFKQGPEVAPVPSVGMAPMPAPVQNFAGLSFNSPVSPTGQAGSGWPPDTNGDVGPNHYILAVNSAFAIYNKTGTQLAAFTEDSLFASTGSNPCNGNSQGDPVVLYDKFHDRWILTNFAFALDMQFNTIPPYYQCFAVSKTNDPVAGGWWLYPLRFDTGGTGRPPIGTFNDYAKLGVWNDGCLYLGANGFDGLTPGSQTYGNYVGGEFASLSLANMEAGQALTWALGILGVNDSFTMIPSHALGTGPAAATPNYFVNVPDLVFGVFVRKFTPGAGCGGGGTLGAPVTVNLTAYTAPTLSNGDPNIVTQPNTAQKLDSLGDRLMQRVMYRKVGAAESLWVTHTVRTSTSSPVAPQWAQINVTGGTVVAVPVQQQIYTPDTTLNRWMASVAVDQAGNMALGYSTSGPTSPQFPSLAYSGRLVNDPLNNLPQTETVLVAGAGAQTLVLGGQQVNRWGDYSAMVVDPVDDCTFWYTNLFYSNQTNGGNGNWQTQIGSFKFPTCGAAATVAITIQTNQASPATPLQFTVDGGALQTAPQTLQWTVGSSHTVQFTSPAFFNSGGSLYAFSAWSDGPTANPRTIVTPGTAATYTANFGISHYLNMTVNPSGAGTTTPVSGYYPAGSVQPITATPTGGNTFTNWTCVGTGCFSGATAAGNATMSAPITETANFSVGAFTAIRVNAGSPTNYVDPTGVVWSADTGFQNGVAFASGVPIVNTTTLPLYQTERFAVGGPLNYSFTVPNGQYKVKLKFAEIFFSKPGQRVFNVTANGTQVETNLDIVARAGASNTAYDDAFLLTVSTGAINLSFVPVTSNPKVSAIEITPVSAGVLLSPSIVGLAPSGTVQFTGGNVGGGSAGVTYSLSPNVGAITAGGFYTAPSVVSAPQKVTVTATATDGSNKSASSIVVLSPPVTAADIGTPNAAGSFSFAAGAATISGAGDVNGSSDSFQYVYFPLTGDASISARVVASGCCALPTKAGVMIRESAAAGSTHAFMSIYSNIVGLLETRTATGGATNVAFGGAGVYWVKLTRVGNTFTGYISAEGNSWIQVGSPVTIAMASSYLAGFAVSSGFGPAYTVVFDSGNTGGPVSISVDQRLSALAAGQAFPFTATTIGGAAGATWSVAPATGTINPATGLYTAPASITNPSQQSVTVTATSTADATKSDSISVVLANTLPQPVRVNAGGPAHYDPNGVYWNADANSTTGNVYSAGNPISNTTTPYLYQSERFNTSNVVYTFPVPNGSYNVKLKFAEIFFTSAGQRVFNIQINGTTVQSNFDPFVAAGNAANRAVDLTFPVTVSTGQIQITLVPVTSAPKVNAIEIQ